MAADGATQEAIASAVGLSVKTMARIYADELLQGGELIRRAVLAAQLKKALAGNTSAANFVTRELDKDDGEGVYRAPSAPVAAKLGKKEQRQADAEAIGGIFSPRPPPTRLAH